MAGEEDKDTPKKSFGRSLFFRGMSRILFMVWLMIRRMRWWKRGLLLVLTIFLATKAGNQTYLLCYRVYADREAQNRVPLQLPQDDKLPPDGFKTPLSSGTCITRFVQYRSSQYELYWKKVWEANPFPTEQEYCKSAYADESAIANWLRGVRALNRTRGMELPPDVEALKDSSAAAPLIFSEFVYEVHCAQSRPTRVATRIEPLAAGLRHPKALCEAFKTEELAWTAGSWLNPYRTRNWFKQLIDRDYLVLEGNESASFMQSGQSLLMDLGASTWNTGLGGASQKYLVNHYHNRGIDFNRILLWESTPMTPAKVFKDVPLDVLHSYQYFNLPASSNATSPANPWNILKRISSTKDFVSVKLDIDRHPVEMEFVQQLLEAPELLDLVDELFFEHHVNFQPLRDCCWRFGLLDHRASVLDTYNLLLWLRNRGVRAHGWP